MNATDELRRLLDERGAKTYHEQNYITWRDANDYQCFAFEAYERPGLLRVHCNLTPEQAIAATLGNECEKRMSDETTLLPCQFCGSDEAPTLSDVGDCEECVNFDDCTHRQNHGTCEGCDEWERPMFVVCDYNVSKCGACGPYRKTRAEAIAAWNTRVAHGTLTAEQVSLYLKAMALDLQSPNPFKSLEEKQAIIEKYAHEIVELGSGTCKNISEPPSGFLCSECRWGDFSEPSHLLTTAKFTNNDGGPNFCPNCGKKVEK